MFEPHRYGRLLKVYLRTLRGWFVRIGIGLCAGARVLELGRVPSLHVGVE